MNVLALPVLVPLVAATLLMFIPNWRFRLGVSTLASGLTLAAAWVMFSRTLGGEVLVVQMADWPAPWGISLVADGLSGIMVLLSAAVGLMSVLFAGSSLRHEPRRGRSAELNKERERFGAQALLQFLFMGVNMSLLTGDLFNLFVAFEVMLISSYGLLLLGNELPQLREGFKYVVINLVSSAIFVVAAGFAYGLFGTLNMADIAQRVAGHGPDLRVTAVCALLALVFATKTALFPLGFWLPNAYPVPAAFVSAFFAAVLTKVGAYTLIRTFTLMFPQELGLQFILLLLAGLTMLVGALGMIARQHWRHALAFANVASIGYLIMGAFTGTAAGLSAGVYYLIHSVLLVFMLFLLAALGEKIGGLSYRSSHGHLKLYPWLGVAFFIGTLALAGLPPLSGFIGKYALIAALFGAGTSVHVGVGVSAVVTGFLLLYAAMQIWRGFFWGPGDAVHRVALPNGMSLVAATAVMLVLGLTVFSGPVFDVAQRTASQLRTPEIYIEAVLGPEPLLERDRSHD